MVVVEWRQRRSSSLCLASSLIDWSVRRPKAVVNICLRVLVRQEGQARHVPPSVSLQLAVLACRRLKSEPRFYFYFYFLTFLFKLLCLERMLQFVQDDDQAAANSHRMDRRSASTVTSTVSMQSDCQLGPLFSYYPHYTPPPPLKQITHTDRNG